MSSSHWRQRATRTVFQSPWFRLQQDDLTLPGGRDITYTFVDHGGYVVVVPLLADGRLVMEQVYRHTLGRSLLECPSGGLDGEGALPAGRRELEEETGYVQGTWTQLGSFAGSPGISNERFHVCLAQGVVCEGVVAREDTEEIEVQLLEFAETCERARRGEIEDAPSALALLLAEAHLR
jgi:ADP-ribose pyrophosphatase